MGKHFSNKHFSKKRRRNLRSLESAEIIEFQSSKFEFERSLPDPLFELLVIPDELLLCGRQSGDHVPQSLAQPLRFVIRHCSE